MINSRIKSDGLKEYTFKEITQLTQCFSKSNEIGKGGYGHVYKGILADGKYVAIKRADEGSLQGSKEFYNEIQLLSRLRHKNLVSLVGYCDEKSEQVFHTMNFRYQAIPIGFSILCSLVFTYLGLKNRIFIQFLFWNYCRC